MESPLGASLIVAFMLSSMNGALAQQEGARREGAWVHPVTPWGDPDLRGTWPIGHLIAVPFERPEQYGERRLMSDEELEAVRRRVEARNRRYDDDTEEGRLGQGHWAEPTQALRLTSLIVDPPNGRMPALTAAALEMRKSRGSTWQNTVFDSIEDFDSWDRCITSGMPVAMLPRNYNNGIEILQSPGYVVLRLEMSGTRIIPLDGRAPLPSEIRHWMGEPRGRWEGNTLVVETTNFTGLHDMTRVGVTGSPAELVPTSDQLRTVERFTRVDDDTIEYELTIDDPIVLTGPFTIAYPMWRDDDYVLYEYACHEGNTAIRNYIETSRYERGLAR
jgi:hypothetical protein